MSSSLPLRGLAASSFPPSSSSSSSSASLVAGMHRRSSTSFAAAGQSSSSSASAPEASASAAATAALVAERRSEGEINVQKILNENDALLAAIFELRGFHWPSPPNPAPVESSQSRPGRVLPLSANLPIPPLRPAPQSVRRRLPPLGARPVRPVTLSPRPSSITSCCTRISLSWPRRQSWQMSKGRAGGDVGACLVSLLREGVGGVGGVADADSRFFFFSSSLYCAVLYCAPRIPSSMCRPSRSSSALCSAPPGHHVVDALCAQRDEVLGDRHTDSR